MGSEMCIRDSLHTTDTERDTAYETTPMTRTIAVVNATGRQAASLIRVASAVGYHVRAQIHSLKGIIAQELQGLPNVSLFQGPLLDNVPLMDTLFEGAHLAFINTTSQAGDEVAIGRALADADDAFGRLVEGDLVAAAGECQGIVRARERHRRRNQDGKGRRCHPQHDMLSLIHI